MPARPICSTSAAAAQNIAFQYSLTATALKTGAYVASTALDFASPVTGGTVGAVNGNLPANRKAIGPVTISNLVWQPGTTLWLRWNDPDHSGYDHGLAIDDFSFQAASSSAQYNPPAGYYSSAVGLTGYDLQVALHNIIAGHTVVPFTSSSGVDSLSALKALDEDPSDPSKVKLVFSGGSAAKGDYGSV